MEHTADVLFKAEADTLDELFAQCGQAVEDTQVNLAKVKDKEEIEFTVEADTLENLLFDFLGELVFYKDSELLIFKDLNVKIKEIKKENKKGYSLYCIAKGEEIDRKRHDLKVDVKAVTMHLLEVKKKGRGWEAQVLLDI